jgi:integrase
MSWKVFWRRAENWSPVMPCMWRWKSTRRPSRGWARRHCGKQWSSFFGTTARTCLALLWRKSRSNLGTLGDVAKAFPGLALPDLKTAELDAWLGSLPFKPKTKNGMRIILVACGNWAEGRGYLVKGGSPFPAMIRYKESKDAVSIFSPENISSLLAKADNTLRPFLALGAFAGLRMAELQRLDWSEIDLVRGYVTVDANKAKTRQRRLVPISDNLKRWLMTCKRASGPVCLHKRPQIAAARLCENYSWKENGLRHSFISYRLAILHDTARVALEAGNSPEVIFSHYRELVTPDVANEWFNVQPRSEDAPATV